ncbi:hypothetical protein [Chryseobacterium scophthalmum]|uniref:hypothetical protein n=1 Tax=Chryseobacterium scophthalmum TaxID=59733 RepID=UPI00117D75D9
MEQITVQNGRNRDTNPSYSQLATLVKIDYPTGGSKKLYYESNRTYMTNTSYDDNFTEPIQSIVNKYPENPDINTNVYIPSSMLLGKVMPRLKIAFGNSCQNNNDNINQIRETMCFGAAKYGSGNYGSSGPPKEYIIPDPSASIPVNVILNRMGNCKCSYSLSLVSRKYYDTEVEIPLGGLRIRKIEDINENNIANIFQYKYNYFDNLSNKLKESGVLNLPFQYTSLRKNLLRRFNDNGGEVYGGEYIKKYVVVSNSSGSYNAYGTSDIVTYSQVTEYNDLGSVINKFTQNRLTGKLHSHFYGDYNNWKGGLLKKSIMLNKLNDTIKIQDYKYEIKLLKNPLAGYIPLNGKDISFGLDLDIMKYNKQISSSPPIEAELYDVQNKYIAIESGKIENMEIITKEFLGNKIIESKTRNIYGNDLQKPINLQSAENLLPSGEQVKISYSYAHEKDNQYLIGKNMIGIPLETTIIRKKDLLDIGKIVSKSEIVYPISQSEANTKTSGLALPYKINSTDLLNIVSAEVIYDKYDSKGNIQQYTTKDGIVTSVIWGYNSTQPIAKITGVPYSVASGLAAEIISASNGDIDAGTEQTLIGKLDIFRKESALQNAQISTYTYDPLIGVTSITPPSGIREIYKYDSANRLENIKDINGKLLKEFKYNYKH